MGESNRDRPRGVKCEVPLAGPTPVRASQYVPPTSVPSRATHETFEMETVKLTRDVDARRAVTIRISRGTPALGTDEFDASGIGLPQYSSTDPGAPFAGPGPAESGMLPSAARVTPALESSGRLIQASTMGSERQGASLSRAHTERSVCAVPRSRSGRPTTLEGRPALRTVPPQDLPLNCRAGPASPGTRRRPTPPLTQQYGELAPAQPGVAERSRPRGAIPEPVSSPRATTRGLRPTPEAEVILGQQSPAPSPGGRRSSQSKRAHKLGVEEQLRPWFVAVLSVWLVCSLLVLGLVLHRIRTRTERILAARAAASHPRPARERSSPHPSQMLIRPQSVQVPSVNSLGLPEESASTQPAGPDGTDLLLRPRNRTGEANNPRSGPPTDRF